VAITGFKTDGNAFIDDALARGAVAVVTEKEQQCGVPLLMVPNARQALADLAAHLYRMIDNSVGVCAVTGTNGKTTACFLLKNILEARGEKVGLISSLVYDTGAEKIPARRTTPESLDIFRLLYAMRKNQCTSCVMETSSHALMLERVRNVEVQVALFTNLTRDHLDFHQDMKEYLEAKARLLDMVTDKDKWAVINYDSEPFRSLIPRVKCQSLAYSLNDEKADVFLRDFHMTPEGSSFVLHTPEAEQEVTGFNLPGRFNLYNALAAGSAALAYGAEIDTIVKGLQNARVVPGRLERIESSAPFTVFLDFAHTPDALERTIETMREIGKGRILTLFGCGGDRDRGKRSLMGKAVTGRSEYAVLTEDNVRGENPQQIFDDVKPGFEKGSNVEIIPDRRTAIAHVLAAAREDDMVLIAGKGDETFNEVNGVRRPWSDRDVVREELSKLGYKI